MGFKNATDGDIRVAVDAIRSASQSHHFLSVTKQGRSAIFRTAGNEDAASFCAAVNTHLLDMFSVQDTAAMLTGAGLPARIMIDASHANSRKVPARQIDVVNDIAAQVGRGNEDIFGVMIESNLVEGRQDVLEGQPLTYGQSITDVVAWADTEPLLENLAQAVKQRRALRK